MNNRKSHNSALIVATLGVYLGLVLTGGTSQIFAHAAMTRHFDPRDDIEFREDLDNQPDGHETARLRKEITDLKAKYLWFNDRSIHEYADLVEQIVAAYPGRVSQAEVLWTSEGDTRPSRTVTAAVNFVGDTRVFRDLDRDVIFVGNGLPGDSFSFAVTRNSREDQFRFQSNSVSYDSGLVLDLYNRALELHRRLAPFQLNDLILKNTQVNFKDTNLIISTRLPRGSLDSLLAVNAK